MAKTEKLFSKAVMMVFLVLLIVGFVVPAILNNPSSNPGVEPRMCNTDADCYLFCEDKPVEVVCLQNLCLVNSCEEKSYYGYSQTPVSFIVNIQNITLEERSDEKDIFVKFKGNEVQVFASKLPLYYILEKADIILDTQCLTFDQKQYCSSDLRMGVNGTDSTAFGNYVPQEGDVIEIGY
ncbi:MAG: hypothetical protein Q8R47_04705 [Nanoarchaeota archaeon]|nr:hypothetical protein [Nanoarchaeota archaeon]